MSRIRWENTALLLVVGALLLPVRAAEPVRSSPVGSVADLTAEAESNMRRLAEYLSNPRSYASSREQRIPQAAGVLACAAQALTEHPGRETPKIAAAQLRGAAVRLTNSDSFVQATAAYAAAKQAMNGENIGTAKSKSTWKHLIGMEVSMKVMELRSNRIRRGLRRFRHPLRDSRHAVTLAVLGQAMRADTDDLDSPAEIAKWKKLSDEYLAAVAALATAMRNKDKADAKKQHVRFTKSCKVCHALFRDN